MSKKLLLADDSITIQKVVGITFANEDYDLTIVDNGEAALRKAQSDRPDLIMADIFMPGKDGYELCAAVKQDPSLRTVPVLLLTGTFEPFDEDKARNAGAESWIAKPFESQALVERVEELLAAASQAAPAPSFEPATEAATPVAGAIPPAAPFAEEPVAAVAPTADEWEDTFEFGEDESWGDVSLDEEELGEPPAPEAPVSEEVETAFFASESDDLLGGTTEEELTAGSAESGGAEEDETFIFEEDSFVMEEEAGEGVTMPAEGDDVFGFEEEAPAFEEEPIVEAPEPEPEIFSAEIKDEETFVFEEETPVPAEETIVPEVAEEESDVLALDEVDILEEEELGAPGEMPAAQAEAEAIVDEKEIWGEAAAEMPETQAEEDFALIEEGPEWGEGEEEIAPVPPVAPSLETPPQPSSAADVEERVRALTDEELAEVVEKVAGEVIERLAGTLLEKIAWEVVPDMAESLIKGEIRKIKEGTQQ